MTVAAKTPSGDWQEDGVSTEFPLEFRFLSATDIRAARELADGSLVNLTYGVDFTVTGGQTDAGGTLIVTTPASAPTKLHAWRDTVRSQTTDYATADTFPAETHEAALDKARLIDQEQDVGIGRSLKVGRGKLPPEVGDISNGQVLALVSGRLRGVDNSPGGANEAADRAEDARDAAIVAQHHAEDEADDAEGSADAAAASAGAAAGSATNAGASAAQASGSALAASGHAANAALAAATAPNIYANTAAGLAAVADGATFWVATSPDTLTLYRRAGAVANLVLTQQSSGFQVARVVQTYPDRAAIPTEQRYPGMSVTVAKAVDLGGGRYRPLRFVLSHTDLTNTGWSIDDDFASNWAEFLSPPIFDGGVMLFPAFYVLGYESLGYGTLYEPSSGTVVASPASLTNAVRRHVFVKSVYEGGGSLEDAIIEVDDNAYPLRDTNDAVVLAVTRNGRLLDARDYTVAGDLPGGAVANQFRYGKEVDRAPFIYPGPDFADEDAARAEVVEITDTDLLALGLTKGIRGRATFPATMGDYRDSPIAVGDWIVARFYLHAETAGQFGYPSIFIYTSENAINLPIPLLTFREINAHVREYYYAGKVTAGGNGKWAVGSNADGTSNLVTVTGVQFHCSRTPAFWISSGDYPAPIEADPLMADELFMVSDRQLPLFAGNGMANRTIAASADVATWPEPPSDTTVQPYFRSGPAQHPLWLDPAPFVGQDLQLIMRAEEAVNSILLKVLPVHVRQVPLAVPVNIDVVYLTDSHGASAFPYMIRAMLAAWNINVTFHGTLENGPYFGEGRGGWGIANLFGTYQLIGGGGSDPVWTSVVGAGAGQTSAYLTGGFDVHKNTNPFLNNGASASTAPVIPGNLPLLGGGNAGGFKFDLLNWATRFGIPTDAKFVLTCFGDNDVGQVGGAGALARMNQLYPILLAECRRTFAGARIMGWAGAIGLTNEAEIKWKDTRPVLASQLAAVRAAVTAGDNNLHYVSTWMHHAIRSGFPLNTGILDAATGVTATTLRDAIHPDRFPGRAQSLEALAVAIANFA